MNPKVLVAIPFHEKKRYSIKHVFDIVQKLKMKDNIEVVMRWDLEEYGGKDNVKKQREFFRKLMLDGDYTHLFFLGADTIPSDDVLEKLLKHNKNIVGGVYWGRKNAANGNPSVAVAWINKMDLESQKRIFLSNSLLEIDGMGMDCVLLSREVVEKISWLSWKQNDDDYPFYDKAKELGYSTYIDTSIQCKHYFNNKEYVYKAEIFSD